jgi:hypothetical protein
VRNMCGIVYVKAGLDVGVTSSSKIKPVARHFRAPGVAIRLEASDATRRFYALHVLGCFRARVGQLL